MASPVSARADGAVGLINGRPQANLDPTDRGFTLGDGLFETIAVRTGSPRFWDDHCQRLRRGCQRLGIPKPAMADLRADVEQVLTGAQTGTLRITVTRGPGARGYAPPAEPAPTRAVVFHPHAPPADPPSPVRLRWCSTRLALQPALAGLKHLNRLEQVLARSEWADPAIDEGVMLGMDGRVVECIASNLFLVRDGALVTPLLEACGVAGVMRGRVLCAAAGLRIATEVRSVAPGELAAAEALFVTSATRGLAPVAELGERAFATDDPVTQRLQAQVMPEA